MTEDEFDALVRKLCEGANAEIREGRVDADRVARQVNGLARVMLSRRRGIKARGGDAFAADLAWAIESAAQPKLDSADVRAEVLRYLVECHRYIELLHTERQNALATMALRTEGE